MGKKLKCPVCGKTLTQTEYDRALGLWKGKQEHIQHLEEDQAKLKKQGLELRRAAVKQNREFRKREAAMEKKTRRLMAEERKKATNELREQRARWEKSLHERVRSEVRRGVKVGVEEQRKQYKKQEAELRKTKNKMDQLERSLALSANKYEIANDEIKRLKEQIKKGITPQIEGLLEEGKLLKKLVELFPHDKFEHPGKGGDIIQVVRERNSEAGRIVYECKRVKHFDKKHVEQAREARRIRKADFAVLVTNAFPAKQQFYFVEKTVFVISPLSLEPVTYTLRESLVRMALLKITSKAKEEAVQRVYDYLSSSEYHSKINDIAGQLFELGKDLKSEISTHKRVWAKRYGAYRSLFSDVGAIDYRLKELANPKLEQKAKMLPAPKKEFMQISDLES
ncbi:MAG: DUF2130 domain-containing protein [Candidatus Acidiferrales bacterium]